MDRRRGKYRADGDAYAPLHGCNEFLLALGSIPGIQMSFFSFGRRLRNEELVAEIIDDTLSLIPGSEETPPGLKQYSVFSQHEIDLDGSKRLGTLIQPNHDMEQTIMVDDMASSVSAHGEEKNFLPVYSGDFQFTGPGIRYAEAVFAARRDNSLVRVLGMLLWCVKMSKRNNISVVQALANLQWDTSSRRYRHRATNSEKIYTLGLEAMRRFTPDFQLLDSEKKGFLPWLPPLAELNPHCQANVILWYQHFGFQEQQVRRIFDSFSSCSLLLRDLQAFKTKFVTVEVTVGDKPVNLPKILSADAIKSVAEDVLAYGLQRNFELVQRALVWCLD